jgi:DNA-binding NtrC family response regulator
VIVLIVEFCDSTLSTPQARSNMKRVLIIEDDIPLSEAFRKRLTHNGFEVVLARTKSEAYKAFDANPDFFVMLVDGWMDGATDTCDLIREFRKTYKGHMIAMSGKDDTREHQVEAGCNHESFNKPRAVNVAILLAQESTQGARS